MNRVKRLWLYVRRQVLFGFFGRRVRRLPALSPTNHTFPVQRALGT